MRAPARALALTLLCVAGSARATSDDPSALARSVGEKFAAECGAGHVDAVLALYREDARVAYPGAGETATNRAELRALVKTTCVAGQPPLRLLGYRAVWVDPAHTVIASLGDWSVSGTGPDGKTVTTPVRATEVLVKTPQGWLYVVDHASIGVPPALPQPPPPPRPAR
jgi:ketosteroid isomerase-like protein